MTPFESDGVYAGIPFWVLPDLSVRAMLQAELVKFKTMDQFRVAVDNAKPPASALRPVLPQDLPENTNGLKANITPSARPPDYYSVLLEAIHRAEHNSAQLRALVYERARFNLKREFLFGYASLGLAEVVQHVNDFELAVARIEANAVDAKPSPAYREQLQRHEVDYSSSGGEIQISPPKAPPAMFEGPSPYYFVEDRKLEWWPIKARPYLQITALLLGSSLIAIIFIGAGIIAGALWRSPKEPPRIEIGRNQPTIRQTSDSRGDAGENGAGSTNISLKVPFPLPTSFGIYALSDGKLSKLEVLPIRIPAPRVPLSAEITNPSITTISGNKPVFILFRRDLLNKAPENVSLRVVARVEHETKFVGGKPTTTNLEPAWRVRNISREYKVSPIVDHPEMVMAHADDDLVLAAGRYVLVLDSFGYDFMVDGPIQSPAHCLDGFETVNGTVFSECRKGASADHAGSGL